ETERFYLARFYSEAVEAAGGAPLHVPLIPRREFIEALVGRLGGVLLPGSDSDVDPQLYGREPQRRLGSVHPLRDATDLLLLQATAWSADGLVEAVEDTRQGRFAVGVQWHPELGWEGDEFSRALFDSFVRASGEFASDKARD